MSGSHVATCLWEPEQSWCPACHQSPPPVSSAPTTGRVTCGPSPPTRPAGIAGFVVGRPQIVEWNDPPNRGEAEARMTRAHLAKGPSFSWGKGAPSQGLWLPCPVPPFAVATCQAVSRPPAAPWTPRESILDAPGTSRNAGTKTLQFFSLSGSWFVKCLLAAEMPRHPVAPRDLEPVVPPTLGRGRATHAPSQGERPQCRISSVNRFQEGKQGVDSARCQRRAICSGSSSYCQPPVSGGGSEGQGPAL